MNKRAIGKAGEDAAFNYLTDQGYRIIFRNFRFSRYGEIDLIAEKSGTICFIEVKARAGTGFGTPAEAVSYEKRKNIVAVANHFLRTGDYSDFKLRIDVIEVYFKKTNAQVRLQGRM